MTINSKADLLKVFDLLHDSRIKEDEISYDEALHILKINLKRDYVDDKRMIQTKRIFPFVKKYSYPLMKSELKLDNIASFRKRSKDASITEHTFNECHIKGDMYILEFCEVLVIEVSFLNNQPSGVMKDTGFDAGDRHAIISLSWTP